MEMESIKTERHHGDYTIEKLFSHSSADRVNTDTVIVKALKEQYPELELVISPVMDSNLLAYAAAGHASYEMIGELGEALPTTVSWKQYIPPARRLAGGPGMLLDRMIFGKLLYKWKDHEFIVYIIDGRDGTQYYPMVMNNYILTTSKPTVEAMLMEIGQWGDDLHDEVWVFESGMWQKSAELYQSVKNASWENVILPDEMKKAIINDHLSFFASRDTYAELKVPWKRGLIYYGPPGNGKTISIKAMMHTLYGMKLVIPTLYVRSLVSVSCPV
jgi:transitional endoplasmic reticulum ATPase